MLPRGLQTISFLIIMLLVTIAIPNSEPVQAQSEGRTRATTLFVGENATYKSIQVAIDNALSGDTIVVYNGTYYEAIRIMKSISLISNNRKNTTIVGPYLGDTVNITADYVNIINFTITDSGTAESDAGIKLFKNSHCNISKNRILMNNYNAIYLDNSHHNCVDQNKISNNVIGIVLIASNNNTITNNNLSENLANIYFHTSNNNLMSNNTHGYNYYSNLIIDTSTHIKMINNSLYNGLLILGNASAHWTTHEIDKSNTVLDKPIYYWKHRQGGEIPAGAGQVLLVNCSGVLINNLNISHTASGITLAFSNHNNIINNTLNMNYLFGIQLEYSNKNLIERNRVVSNFETGIYLGSCGYNEVINNIIMDNSIGIELMNSHDIQIENNTIHRNSEFGIDLESSSMNILKNNTVFSTHLDGIALEQTSNSNIIENNGIINNRYGLSIMMSSLDNKISFNNISSNRIYGIYIKDSSGALITKNLISFNADIGVYISNDNDLPGENNLVYHNNFIFNGEAALDNTVGQWDTGYLGGGNFWSDYPGTDLFSGPGQNQSGGDGLGDKPYEIEGDINGQDRYPLIAPVETTWPLPQTKPTTPRSFQVQFGDGFVHLTWATPAYDGGVHIEQYIVTRFSELEGEQYFFIPSHSFHYNDTNITNGKVYYYKLSARNALGNGVNSSELMAKPNRRKVDSGAEDDAMNEGDELVWFLLRGALFALILVLVIGAALSKRAMKKKVSEERYELDKENKKMLRKDGDQ
ncbi:NosD domain-containing protein [[Eubacterium] cellulosolvens]